ncbi:hypothetical protein EVAR_73665_1 [Eumeta japonica]|uniref:Uncharacterized protein n=1 Tax=Eumeta variegata TaxID=151549 RepID=A0A4C1T9F5_EUMVA|nr:hypothetical protein EVAR_73665_1 [Eumeta japonica]
MTRILRGSKTIKEGDLINCAVQSPPGSGLVLVSCNTLTFCHRGIEAQESLGLVMAYRILRGEKAYGCAIGLLFEPYLRVIISIPWVLVAPGHKANMCLRICKRRVVAVKLRHYAHLSASSHLFGMPGLWKVRGQKGATPETPKQGVCVYSITIYQVNCYLSLASMPGMVV